MDFSLNDDHLMLRDAAETFVAKEVDLAPLLVPGATVESVDYLGLWRKIADLGWVGITIPEAYGGLGMTFVDFQMVVEQIGRSLAPNPYFGTLAGAWTIEAAGTEEQKARLLPEVAAGAQTLALAIADTHGRTEAAIPSVVATPASGGTRLTGESSYVVDGSSADRLVVAALYEGRRRYFLVDRHESGVIVDRLAWRDITRDVSTVRFEDAAGELLGGVESDIWPTVRDRLTFVLAAESYGGMQQSLEDAVAYAKERTAFGKPIGSFQAIKHVLAELKARVEATGAGVLYAGWCLSDAPALAPMAVAAAQSYASEAYREVTHQNIQVFGAIGFTWEMKNHLFFKRARANAELLGSPAEHRERLARMIEGGSTIAMC